MSGAGQFWNRFQKGPDTITLALARPLSEWRGCARPGPKPQNNRRILSGIIHVLKTGCRWQDCPPEYGPYTTVYNRFNRWSGRGIWQEIFETVAGSRSRPNRRRWTALMSKRTVAPAAEKGGLGTGDRCHQRRPEQQDSCACRQVMPPVGLDPHPRQHRRLHRRASMRQSD
jgi:transposase